MYEVTFYLEVKVKSDKICHLRYFFNYFYSDFENYFVSENAALSFVTKTP